MSVLNTGCHTKTRSDRDQNALQEMKTTSKIILCARYTGTRIWEGAKRTVERWGKKEVGIYIDLRVVTIAANIAATEQQRWLQQLHPAHANPVARVAQSAIAVSAQVFPIGL